MEVFSSKMAQTLFPHFIINASVTVQSDSQGQSEALSRWCSNRDWFMRSRLWLPGQLRAVEPVKDPCHVSPCGPSLGLARLTENFNFLKKFKPSWNTQAKHPGAGGKDEHVYWEAPQGDAEAGTQAASLILWLVYPFPRFPSQSTQYPGAQREGRGCWEYLAWGLRRLREQEGDVRLQMPWGTSNVWHSWPLPIIKTRWMLVPWIFHKSAPIFHLWKCLCSRPIITHPDCGISPETGHPASWPASILFSS